MAVSDKVWKAPVGENLIGLLAAEDVYSPEGKFLIRGGTSLSMRVVTFLQAFNIPMISVTNQPELCVEGRLPQGQGKIPGDASRGEIKETGFSALLPVEEFPGLPNEERVLDLVYRELKSSLYHNFSIYSNFHGENEKKREIIMSFVDEVIQDKKILRMIMDVKQTDRYTYDHSIKVCVIALVCAFNMNLGDEAIRTIVIGALLHDIGKRKVRESILMKTGPLTEFERREMERHPLDGFQILWPYKYIPDEVPLMALEHHERCDGSGYPFGRRKNEVHLFSRILAVADVYQAMTANRAQRPSCEISDAIKHLQENAHVLFDGDVVKALVKSLCVYPLGSMVQLSSGESGIVVKTPEGMPLRPTVLVMYDKHKSKLKAPYEMELSHPMNSAVTVDHIYG